MQVIESDHFTIRVVKLGVAIYVWSIINIKFWETFLTLVNIISHQSSHVKTGGIMFIINQMTIIILVCILCCTNIVIVRNLRTVKQQSSVQSWEHRWSNFIYKNFGFMIVVLYKQAYHGF